MSETNGQRPRVMSVPLEPASAGPSMNGGAPPPPPVQAQPMGSHPLLAAASQPVRIDMGSGRLPEGGGNATMKQRSVFEGPRGAGAAVREVKLMGSGVQIQQLQVAQAAQAGHHGTPVQPHARVTATAQPMMAQAAAPAPAAAPPASEAEIERIIERQLPPQGLTKKEAQQLADALSVAIDAAQKATASGVRCFGVDDASIADALKTRDYLANFAYNAGASDRTDPAKLTPDKLNTVERILECQMTQGSGSNTAALVVGGVILGAVGLYLVLNA